MLNITPARSFTVKGKLHFSIPHTRDISKYRGYIVTKGGNTHVYIPVKQEFRPYTKIRLNGKNYFVVESKSMPSHFTELILKQSNN